MKNAVITGCFGGIGYETSRYFFEKGWNVVGLDLKRTLQKDSKFSKRSLKERNLAVLGVTNFAKRFIQTSLNEKKELKYIGDFHKCDLSEEEIVENVCRNISLKYEGIDALVNNAGIEICKKLSDTTNEEWDRIFNINLRSVFLMSKNLYKNLRYASGAIVNVGSVVSRHTSKSSGAYASTKGALSALTRAFALEYARDKIRVNAVLPGAINTKMLREGLKFGNENISEEKLLNDLESRIPIGRIGEAKDIASVIYFLCDKEVSSFMTGQEVVVDGGVSAALSSAR